MAKPMYDVSFYKDRKKEWRWRAITRNGKILADSGEGYKRKGNCISGAKSTLKALSAAL